MDGCFVVLVVVIGVKCVNNITYGANPCKALAAPAAAANGAGSLAKAAAAAAAAGKAALARPLCIDTPRSAAVAVIDFVRNFFFL